MSSVGITPTWGHPNAQGWGAGTALLVGEGLLQGAVRGDRWQSIAGRERGLSARSEKGLHEEKVMLCLALELLLLQVAHRVNSSSGLTKLLTAMG